MLVRVLRICNGKEIQNQEFSDKTGLEWEDYGARMCDPKLGKWMVKDPFADKAVSFSPYAYTVSDPVNLIDPYGKLSISPDAKSEERVALIRIVQSISARIGSMTKKEWNIFSGLSVFKTKQEARKFLRIDARGPVFGVQRMTFGNESKGIDGGAENTQVALGRTTPSKDPNVSAITLDKGLVDAVIDGISSENSGGG